MQVMEGGVLLPEPPSGINSKWLQQIGLEPRADMGPMQLLLLAVQLSLPSAMQAMMPPLTAAHSEEVTDLGRADSGTWVS